VYRLAFLPEVEDDLKRLDKSIRQRILRKTQWLAEHAAELPHEPLSRQWAGMYRLRVGDYRVVYDLDHNRKVLTVYAVGHRREVYKTR
jgi:mRNA interferase RelE/StbE